MAPGALVRISMELARACQLRRAPASQLGHAQCMSHRHPPPPQQVTPQQSVRERRQPSNVQNNILTSTSAIAVMNLPMHPA